MNPIFVHGRHWTNRDEFNNRIENTNHLSELRRELVVQINAPHDFKFPTKLNIERLELPNNEHKDKFKEGFILREFEPKTNYTKRLFIVNVPCCVMLDRWFNTYKFGTSKIINKPKYYEHENLVAWLGNCYSKPINSSTNKRIICMIKIKCNDCTRYYGEVDIVEASIVVNSPRQTQILQHISNVFDSNYSIPNVKQKMDFINKTPYIKTNYFVIIDEKEIDIIDLVEHELKREVQNHFTDHEFNSNDVFVQTNNVDI